MAGKKELVIASMRGY